MSRHEKFNFPRTLDNNNSISSGIPVSAKHRSSSTDSGTLASLRNNNIGYDGPPVSGPLTVYRGTTEGCIDHVNVRPTAHGTGGTTFTKIGNSDHAFGTVTRCKTSNTTFITDYYVKRRSRASWNMERLQATLDDMINNLKNCEYKTGMAYSDIQS